MRLAERGGLRLLLFEQIESAGVVCAISTVPLDVREPQDAREFVKAAGLDCDRIATARQVHHADVVVADPATIPQADGLVTDEPGLPLLLRAADCSLVVVADLEHRAVGAAHAGWKGAARGVVVNLLKKMRDEYNTRPSRCLAGIGPTIGPKRYEVGPNVPTAFLRTRDWAKEYVSSKRGKLFFDLKGANMRFLLECGVQKDAIEISEDCTYDRPDLLHSFRRAGVGAGHHGLVVGTEPLS